MEDRSSKMQFTYDLSNHTLFKKDVENYINSVSIDQLNTIGDNALMDIFLSAANVIELHHHPNTSEVIYCVSGAATASLINPLTKELINITLKPGQVVSLPQGWPHYIVATADQTHLLACFDAPKVQTVWYSDVLRLIPSNVLAHTYCLDEKEIKDALSPIQETVTIGPPKNCNKKPLPSNPKKAYSNAPLRAADTYAQNSTYWL